MFAPKRARQSWVPFAAALVGVLSALLGLGGGELMGPLLLTIGVQAAVTSATTSTTSMLSTSSNMLHYLFAGYLTRDYSLFVFVIGLSGGLVGRRAGLHATKLKRSSVIIIALSVVLVISMGLLAYDMATDTADWSFHALC